MIEHVAIVGAGFSGTLQAIDLLRHDGPRATLIDRSPAGVGVAYGAAHPGHLLNVRAANMSAFPDDPDHFVRWLQQHHQGGGGDAFVPRLTYGVYLRELLDRAQQEAGERLTIVRGDAVDIEQQGDTCVVLADGTRIAADAAVLAVGNLPPHLPAGLVPEALTGDRYWGDPWAPGLTDGLCDSDDVLVIGSGLTMIDVALTLDANGFGGRIVALSRRGLVPRRHAPAPPPWSKRRERPATVASSLVAEVRSRGASIGWRDAVDELRPFTQPMWAQASEAERSRFLRHLRPWWDVHRHRLAPAVADRIATLRTDGRLQVRAGKTTAFREAGTGVDVDWRPRGADAPETLHVRRVVNCTGPQGDLTRTTEPLLQALYARGALRPDAERLGIDVTTAAQTIGADGRPSDGLFALGPMTRGAFWEIVAVPDIRRQTWDLARRLSNAHWVGGEGL